jgi:hypothetical protein
MRGLIDIFVPESIQRALLEPTDLSFRGTFDGGGFAVSGVYINTLKNYQGLFGNIGKELRNLGVRASYIKGGATIGGLAGMSYGMVNDCYSTVWVAGIEAVGGLVGLSGDVVSSYYNIETSRQSDTVKGKPKTTEELKQQSTFAGWDFDKTWGIDEKINDGYPYLRNMLRKSE